jgi:hypothetical protein
MLFQRDRGCFRPQLPFFYSNCQFSECIFTMAEQGAGEADLGAPAADIVAAGVPSSANLIGHAPQADARAAVVPASSNSSAKRAVGRPKGSGGRKTAAAPAASGGAAAPAPPVQEAVPVANRDQPQLKHCPIEYIDIQKRVAKFASLTAQGQQDLLNRHLTNSERVAFEWKNCEAYTPPHDAWPKYAKRGKFINLHRTPHITEIQCFLAYFPSSLWQLHIQETNRYLISRDPEAEAIECNELQAFYGMQIIMGLMPHPRLEEFWREHAAGTPTHMQHPNFKHIMSYKRYRAIKDSLHFANNEHDNGSDPLFKLRAAVDTFRSTFKKMFHMGTDTCIDEGIVPFKGVNPHRRKIPKPGGSTGFKVLILADSDIHYCYDFIVDVSREAQSIRQHITPLVQNLNKGQILYCDRWFGTIDVVEWLMDLQIGYVGTFLENRNPAKMCQLPPHAGQGAFKACSKDGICIVRWNDTSQCCFIMTAVGIDEVQYERKQKTGPHAGRKVPIPAPLAAKKFNFKMGGVDRFDQMKAKFYSCCGRFKTGKWYHKLWFGLVDLALVNAWLLFKHTHENAKHFDFVHALAEQLISSHLLSKEDSEGKGDRTTKLAHFCKDPSTGARPQRACYHCSSTQKRVRTTFGCASCQRALCLDCFASHKKCYPPSKKGKFDFPNYE